VSDSEGGSHTCMMQQSMDTLEQAEVCVYMLGGLSEDVGE